MSQIQVTILAAGMGKRLGRPFPKPLTQLATGQTIMEQQIDNIRGVFGDDVRITIVVGFKLDIVMEHVPDAVFVYNENFDQTNTCKSLLKALRASHEGSVIWMNGDVVFDPFLGSGTTLIAAEQLNRRCYGIEISPAYVAVILQRYVDATGKQPELIEGPKNG